MIRAGVFLCFRHNFIHRRTTSYEVAINANISTSQNLCHFASIADDRASDGMLCLVPF